jgi:hypothetical protein
MIGKPERNYEIKAITHNRIHDRTIFRYLFTIIALMYGPSVLLPCEYHPYSAPAIIRRILRPKIVINMGLLRIP